MKIGFSFLKVASICLYDIMAMVTLPKFNSSPLKIGHPFKGNSSSNHPFSGANRQRARQKSQRMETSIAKLDPRISSLEVTVESVAVGGMRKHGGFQVDSLCFFHVCC